uniref:NADH dehydrogenase [ubiquinone] 1 alpha subcomplex assembly factor 3 n=2 Tax=Clastoptera arizonana TaxID=38151 RepID=A0A1B6CZ84_9HEMI
MISSQVKLFSSFSYRAVRKILSPRNRYLSSYDPDGKTFVTILNQEQEGPLMIDSYSQVGFRLNNGLFAIGPLAVFPRSVMSWNVKGDEDINENSLSLFTNLDPKLDILVIGTSQKLSSDNYIKMHIQKILKQSKLHIEILPTEKACPTFNFLNSEKRFVAAALIPPVRVSVNEDDLFQLAYNKERLRERNILIDG